MVRVSVVVWLAAVAGGFAVWETYQAVPGMAGAPRSIAPGGRTGPSVVVFVHPHCPCTRDVLPGLLAVLAAAPADSVARVVFVRPPGLPDGWERTPSWEIVARAPGVQVRVDSGGSEAAAEGAETSGYVVARDAAGRVAFRGGIGRGRVGANPGLRAMADVLAGRVPEFGEVAVFGCPLTAH